jgi:hypothetical protein
MKKNKEKDRKTNNQFKSSSFSGTNSKIPMIKQNKKI